MFVGVIEVSRQAFDIAIEDDSDHRTIARYYWRARVASDDVTGRYKVERRIGVDLVLGRMPALGQNPRILFQVDFLVFEGTTELGARRNLLSIAFVSTDRSVGEP